MNAVTVASVNEENMLRVMRETLYPGARPESVSMVLGYCRARGLDPLLKPVHIVPMWVKEAGSSRGEMRDVVMPGIALYRIQAARSGLYNGKSEPFFGPDETRVFANTDRDGKETKVTVTFPKWCKVMVMRGDAHFTATEYWTENYATAGRNTDAPNEMWRKRAYGQLAKCAEAQALRMAFPELIGGEPTAEEMDGKVTAPAEPRRVENTAPRDAPPPGSMREAVAQMAEETFPLINPTTTELMDAPRARWLPWLTAAVAKMESYAALSTWRASMGPHLASMAEAGHAELVTKAEVVIDARRDQFHDNPAIEMDDARLAARDAREQEAGAHA